MLVYFLVVLFPFVVELFYNRNKQTIQLNKPKKEKRKRWWYIFIAAFPMFLLIALRNEYIGADTLVYANHFKGIVNSSWSEIWLNTRMESGYLIFEKLVSYITSSVIGFQAIYSLVYLIALTCFVNQLDRDHFFMLFMFGTLGFYTFMFTGVRQCLAISLCWFSFKFIKERRIFPFAILMFIAFFFHKSSILFVSAYFIYPRKISVWSIIAYAGITIFAVLYLDVLQEWFNSQLDYEYGVEGNTGGIIMSVMILCMTSFSIYLVTSNEKLTKNSQGLINIGIIATVLWIVRIFTRVAERPSFYFLICVFASFSYALDTMVDKKEKSTLKLLLIVLSLAFFAYRLIVRSSTFLPYRIGTF